MRIALVGSTGLVGNVMMEVLEEFQFPISDFYPVASSRSVGQEVTLNGNHYTVRSIQDAVDVVPDIAIFSAGGSVSKEWAPKFAENGSIVIDNSSAWRMDPGKKLIVPEINAQELTSEDFNYCQSKLLHNPNGNGPGPFAQRLWDKEDLSFPPINPLRELENMQWINMTRKGMAGNYLPIILIHIPFSKTVCLIATYFWIMIIPKRR